MAMHTGVYAGLVRRPQHAGSILPASTEGKVGLAAIALASGAIAKVVTGSWAWAVGIGIASPIAIGIGLMLGLKSSLAASGWTPVAGPVTASSSSPGGTITPNSLGIVTMVPGNMGTLPLKGKLSSITGFFEGPNVNLSIAGGGTFQSLKSSDQNVVMDGITGTNPNAISFPVMGAGKANLTIGWTDTSGQKQTSTMTVSAST